MATEQQFCLKWNNHRSTLFSVFDTLLEEESLVDVTLSAEGQFLRAHRVILSACSPYFRNMFKSQFLNDKHPVVIMKDVEFENLKSLVEYMYKGEANVPQHMLSAFIKDAESLQIRGLAECASKQFDAEQLNSTPLGNVRPPLHSTPMPKKPKQGSPLGPSGILAARLAKMSGAGGGDQVPPLSMFDFPPEGFPSMLARNPALMAMQQAAAASHHLGQMPKKSRKSAEPRPRLGSPHKEAKKLKLKAVNSAVASTNNNDGDDEEGGLKIDEDADAGKENIESAASKMEEADMADLDHSTGVSDEEEEPSMPGPGGELAEAASDIINPWDGRKLQLSEEQDENSAQDGADLAGFPPLMDSLGALHNGRGRGPGGSSKFSDNPNLGTPESAPERDLSTNKYCCVRCGRSYQHQATLVRHQRYECGIQASYPCDICNRKFKRRDVLKGHKEKCVNKVQAQAALASMTGNPGNLTPRALSPPSESSSGFRPELHHTF